MSDDDSYRPDEPIVPGPPEWWPEFWYRRQAELQERLIAIMRDSPKVHYVGDAFAEVASARLHYDRREVDVALETLVTIGVVERIGGRYRLAIGGDA